MNSHLYQKKTINRINNKLLALNSKKNTLFILNIRLFLSLFILIFSACLFNIGIIIGPLLAIVFYYLFEYLFIDIKIIKRKKKLNEESLPFFEYLLICLKNNGLMQALSNVSNIMSVEIAIEFRKVLKEIEMGKSFNNSLKSLKMRIPSNEIKMLISSLQNKDKNIIEKELKEQIQNLKEKNKLQINYDINLISVKIGIITIIFMAIFVLLVFYQLSILNLF